jgi:hypothetical protein
MKREDHIAYIKDLAHLQDSEGKRISDMVLKAIGRLLDASRGNPARFDAMVKAFKNEIVKKALVEIRISQMKAKKLGTDFGKQKLNDSNRSD